MEIGSQLSVYTARKRYLVIAGTLTLTAAAIIIGGRWAVSPFIDWPLSGLGDHHEIDLIRQYHPHHLVNPTWITATDDDLHMKWGVAECAARGTLLFMGWFVALVLLGRREHRLRIAMANQKSSLPDSSIRGSP
jgi:hypothetical protein